MERPKGVLLVVLIVGMLSFMFLLTDTAISYSDNPEFCILCHSMDEAYTTHMSSNHKQFKCTDCHAPTEYVPKVVFKTKSGMRDLYATTLGEIPPVIRVTEESREILNANCIRCHKSTVEATDMGQGRYCMDCHREIPHQSSQNL